jgi:hypothetical protein
VCDTPVCELYDGTGSNVLLGLFSVSQLLIA